MSFNVTFRKGADTANTCTLDSLVKELRCHGTLQPDPRWQWLADGEAATLTFETASVSGTFDLMAHCKRAGSRKGWKYEAHSFTN